MGKKKQTGSKTAMSKGKPGTGPERRQHPRVDQDGATTSSLVPAGTITQADLEAYAAAERELGALLEAFARMRMGLVSKLWDGALVEEGPWVAALIPASHRYGQRFSPASLQAEVTFVDLPGVRFGRKPVRQLFGDTTRLADVCRLHGVSKAYPDGAEPDNRFLDINLI